MKRRYFLFFVVAALIAALHPALAADPPKITVAPLWRPATQLTTIDANSNGITDPNDDFRYAEAQLMVTTSVKFWAAQLTCTVNKVVLSSYVPGSDPNDWQDDVPVVVWGSDWGIEGDEFTQIPASFNPATGIMTITATRLGNRNGLGSNGWNYTFLLATIRYRVKNVAGASPFTCTANFLNRDGRPVLTPTYTAPAPLTILTGYSISGTVSYQGRTARAGIGVECKLEGNTPVYTTTTAADGKFAINNLRKQSWYVCLFFGNISNPAAGYHPDVYLRAWSLVTTDLIPSYALLPVMLLGGNVDRTTPGSETGIDNADIALLTSNWEKNALGDVNGDAKTDKADLAIIGGNYYFFEDVGADHVLYSLPRDGDGNNPNSHIWLGTVWSGAVTQQIPGNNRDFWPALSPDGTKIAFVREVNGEYALFVAPAAGGAPVRLTPSGEWYNAFAPSWSPDGTRIAFICAWDDQDSTIGYYGWRANQSDICLIDAIGRNWVNITPDIEPKARIYPPAWYSNTELVFGGATTPDNTICPNTICYHNINTREFRLFDPDIPTGADMPSVRFQLVYRYTNGADRRLRVAEFNPDGGVDPFETRGGAAAPFHMDVEYFNGSAYVPISTDVDWYSLAQYDPHIMFYTKGGYDFVKSNRDFNQPKPTWTEPWANWVDDMWGNIGWSGDPNELTELHGLRNTANWTP